MAENQEDRSREDLTEEASPYRIEEFRRRGMVAQSRELTGIVTVLAAGAALYVASPRLGEQLLDFMREMFRGDLSPRQELFGTTVLGAYFGKALKLMALIALPACAAGFVIAVLASFGQIGPVFSLEPLAPDISRINPIKGLQRLFSLRQFLDGLRITLKVIVAFAVIYFIVKSEIFGTTGIAWTEPREQLGILASGAKVMFLSLFGVLALFAATDFGMQKWEFSRKLRMTKQEAKQEHKEREGDPMVKARIRAIQREMARRRMMAAVRKADVVVTNPTHLAVALSYEKDKHLAPKVVAKGADFVAQKIKKVASEAGVPLVENVPLARTLFRTVKIGQYVPRALYQAVAEVLAYVYRLRNRRFT